MRNNNMTIGTEVMRALMSDPIWARENRPVQANTEAARRTAREVMSELMKDKHYSLTKTAAEVKAEALAAAAARQAAAERKEAERRERELLAEAERASVRRMLRPMMDRLNEVWIKEMDRLNQESQLRIAIRRIKRDLAIKVDMYTAVDFEAAEYRLNELTAELKGLDRKIVANEADKELNKALKNGSDKYAALVQWYERQGVKAENIDYDVVGRVFDELGGNKVKRGANNREKVGGGHTMTAGINNGWKAALKLTADVAADYGMLSVDWNATVIRMWGTK